MVYEPAIDFKHAKLFRVKAGGELETEPLCVAYKYNSLKFGSKEWTFYAYKIREGNLSSTHADPFVAAAQVILNIV
jgi:hypothetical protein